MEQRAYLLMDNCSSHKSDDATELCEDNNIELVYFVPNSTRIFQPLDPSFFSAFKARIRSYVPTEKRGKQNERLLMILESWDAANTVANIRGSFKMAGFVYMTANSRNFVSFSREAVRNLEATPAEQPAPGPRGGRIPLQ